LAQLIAEVQDVLAPGCVIALPDGLVVEAFCHGCGSRVIADVPGWGWHAEALAQAAADASNPAVPDAGGLSPLVVSQLDGHTPPRTRAVTCQQAGFPALAVVEAACAGRHRSASSRLAGDIRVLFETTTASGRHQLGFSAA
jgi:hypothetical protein